MSHLVHRGTTSLMVVGHNPGSEEMVTALTGRAVELKTACCAIVCGEADDFTSFLNARKLTLVDLLSPKAADSP